MSLWIRRTIIKILQWIASFISWLTISPLFFYITKRWNLIGKKIRVVLLLISPLFLIVYAIIFFYSLDAYNSYHRKYRFTDTETLEKITGIDYPDFKIVEYKKDKSSFLGDYNDILIIEFEEIPSEEFYTRIDSLIATEDSEWFKHENTYSYSKMWGNGLPAPRREEDDEDMSFSISFDKGSKQATLRYGAW